MTTQPADRRLVTEATAPARVAAAISEDPDTRDALDVAVAADAADPGTSLGGLLTQDVRSTRSGFALGPAGLSGRTPVALRFDDYHDYLGPNIIPLLAERRLPASLACISQPGAQAWWTTTTWTTIRQWNRDGVEIWSHGATHGPWTDGYAGLVEEIVASRSAIEAQNLRVHGYAMPGIPGGSGPDLFGSSLYRTEDWATAAGRLIQATYPMSETDMTGKFRHVPSPLRHGLGHVTISDVAGYTTLAGATRLVEAAVGLGVGVEVMVHAGLLDTAGHMTLADFTAFLDYLVDQREAGVIEVVTPSFLAQCNPASTSRLDLLTNGTFMDTTTTGVATEGVWQNIDGADNLIATVAKDPRERVGNVLRITGPGLTPVHQSPSNLMQRGIGGTTLMFQAKARGYGGDATVKVRQEGIAPYAALNAIDYTVAVTTDWQTIRMPWTPHPNTDVSNVALSTTAGAAEVTDAHLFLA